MLEPQYLLFLSRQLTTQLVVGALLLLKHHVVLGQTLMQRPATCRSADVQHVICAVVLQSEGAYGGVEKGGSSTARACKAHVAPNKHGGNASSFSSVPVIKHVLMLMVVQLFEVLVEVVGFPTYHLFKLWSTEKARVLLCNSGMQIHIQDLHTSDQA